MTFVRINGQLYPAEINGKMVDHEWDDRDSKAITLEMDYATAMNLFVDGQEWSIVYQPPAYTNEKGETITPEAEEYDNSEYIVAGSVTDHRDGTVTVKMGMKTDAEMLAELVEVLNEEA